MKLVSGWYKRVGGGWDLDRYVAAYMKEGGDKGEGVSRVKQVKKDNRPLFLVVDDDEMLLKTLAMQLLERGYRVAMAKDYDEVKEHLDKLKPDVMVFDYSLPQKNGVDMAVDLTGDSRYRKAVKIIMSAYAEASDKAGKNKLEFIEKPFSVDELLDKVKRLSGDEESGGRRLEKIKSKKVGFMYAGVLADIREMFLHSVH